ncbi:RNA polymerase factor sigma-54 [soil metagenome]
MLKPSLQLRLGQQLTMTPQLQQAIRLLQLPIMDLQTQIQDALESNIMLESADEAQEATPRTEESPREAVESRIVDDTWSDTRVIGPRNDSSWSSSEPRPTQDFEDHSGETLRDHLLWQLEFEKLDARNTAIGQAIIDAVNDDGYLIDSLEMIQASLQPELSVSLQEIEHVLAEIQHLDPSGVAARSLGECLCLQLRQLEPETPGLELALTLADKHLELVAEHQYAALRRELRATEDELQDALALVRSCHPRPGSSIHAGTAEYVVPDVFVRKQDDHWLVEVNAATAPRIRVNQSYAGSLSRDGDHDVLRTQLQEARWLVRSLEIRNDTLLKVARCIVERQQAFLEHGEEAMEPMVLRDVAEAVGMHESTISRVTTNKYMHTPRGVIEFRYFFSSQVQSSDGSGCSSTAIRAKMRKLISHEDSRRPMSDNKIAKALSADGIQVARRTVAKYREAMQIPSSSERRRLAAR